MIVANVHIASQVEHCGSNLTWDHTLVLDFGWKDQSPFSCNANVTHFCFSLSTTIELYYVQEVDYWLVV